MSRKKQCLYLIFFRELCSAVHFWKIWTDNNCNFATDLDPDLLFGSWLFSAIPATLRRISSHRPGFPANVQTSGDILCCQILSCLLYPSASRLLSLRWLQWQPTCHLEGLPSETFTIRPLSSALKKQLENRNRIFPVNRKTKECPCCMEPEESYHYIDFRKQTVCNSIVWLLNRLHFSSRVTRLE